MKRNTDQRRAIQQVFQQEPHPLTAQEILEHAQTEVPNLGLATVYRNLKSLTDSGLLRLVELPGEPCRYELTDQDHHHHFKCLACGRVFDIPGCVAGIAGLLPEGFKLRSHEILLYGHCPNCPTQTPQP